MGYLPITIAIIVSVLCVQTLAAPQQDLVLPFDQVPYNQHKWYSGYLQIEGGRFHYVFFDSQRDPDNDPVYLWLNGGPGCSSMIGMLQQIGPFVYQHNTTQLSINQYAWNKKANLLFIESPGGVGYSKSNRMRHSDATVALDNLHAVLKFFQKFPNLKKNDFYIGGQSYAGIYVPWLAWKILQYNDLPSSRDSIVKLKGIMVGNACTDPLECSLPGKYGTSIYQYEFLYNHGYYTSEEYNMFRAVCILGYNTTECQKIRQRMDQFFASTRTSILNIYNKCYGLPSENIDLNVQNLASSLKFSRKLKQSGRKQIFASDLDCDDSSGILDFFNKHGNFQRLHVQGTVQFQICNDEVFDTFDTFENASIWIYPTLMKAGLRIMVYSGDVDADVPITGTISWLMRFREQQGLPITEPWRQWWVKGLHKHEDQVGGMTWQMRGITFASIKGAGHEVPRDKHAQSYTLIDSFLNGKVLPYKDQA